MTNRIPLVRWFCVSTTNLCTVLGTLEYAHLIRLVAVIDKTYLAREDGKFFTVPSEPDYIRAQIHSKKDRRHHGQ